MRSLRPQGAVVRACGALVVLFTLPSVAAAQLPALPFYFRPMHDPYPSVAIYSDYGVGYEGTSDLKFLGLRGSLESNTVRGTLQLGSVMPDQGSNKAAVGGSFAYNLVGPFELVVVDAQLGLAYFELGDEATGETRQLNIPIGVGAGVNARLPTSLIANVEPWAAIRAQIRYSEESGGPTDFKEWRGGGGLGAGIRLIHPTGFGFHAAIDWLIIRTPTAPEWDHELALGLGLQWRF